MTDRFALSYAAGSRWRGSRSRRSGRSSRRPTWSRSSPAARAAQGRRALLGRCPFHEERTPSFSVNPADKLYHCFGCGKGGDVITFVRETENLDFAGAVEWLAERFRVTLEYEETSPQQEESRKRRDRLHARARPGRVVLRALPLGGRGRRARCARTSRAAASARPSAASSGSASRRGPALAQKARQKGFTRDELRAAGLTNARGNDYFPQRLMFPLADARGRIVGFQARKLHDDDPLRGKYVNSPEGELFHKSAILYGLNLARTAIAKQERAVVVEGNTDVIALRQAGFEPVVASMGTALTERQLKELQRLTRRLYLCFDSDAAGEDGDAARDGAGDDAGLRRPGRRAAEGSGSGRRADGFEQRLAGAECYVVHRVRLELERTPDRQEAFGKREDAGEGRGLAARAGRAAAARRHARPAAGDARRLGRSRRVQRQRGRRAGLAGAAREGRAARAARPRRLRRPSRRS